MHLREHVTTNNIPSRTSFSLTVKKIEQLFHYIVRLSSQWNRV